ncbi:meroterpenoid PM-122-9-7565 [Aspergillus udagawae]|uniref:Meroterpenoid PM-122-9-7565 n=1 Tax=Aspergillus udagawae TaxID=91492 RepID=A0ABQ1ACI9_9EURO|nr:meroterpenoid PM-122-9-7565 [Aspergillus udagawae]
MQPPQMSTKPSHGTTYNVLFLFTLCIQCSFGSLLPKVATPLKEHWTDDADWHVVSPTATAEFLIPRLVSPVLAGDELGGNPVWLRAVLNYTKLSMKVGPELNLWPRLLRPLVSYLKPSCYRLRKYIREAKAIASPVIRKRALARTAGVQEEYLDGIRWFEEIANGRYYHPILVQMMAAVAFIETTGDLLAQVLIDLCGHADWEKIAQEMREEIISVFRETAVYRTALDKLTLMDSVLKESLRLKPASIMAMGRFATEDVELSDGTKIPKNSAVCIANVAMRDPNIYPNPDTFDPYRFANLVKAGDSTAYLVTPSPKHLGFGLGHSACPGRFLAALEVKAMLCHMLLKYDIKLADDCRPTVLVDGAFCSADPSAKIVVRRRQEEISL